MSSAQPPSDGDRPARARETAPDTASGAGAAATPPRPARRTPSPRKRPAAKPTEISPNGEAPEILDAMLGKPVAAPHETEIATVVLPTADEFYREQTAETAVLSSAETEPPAPVQALAATEGTTPANEAPPHEAPAESTAEPTATGTPTAEARRRGRSVNELADRLDDSRFFSSLFDFTFTSYVTRKLAGPVYVVGLVLIGLGIIVGFANSLGIAIAANSPGGAFVFLLGVLVTLVAAILSVLLLRVTIEVFCAIIEIAQNTRRRRPPRD